jgi:hypothetical protein
MERVNDRCGKPLEVVGKRRGGRRLDDIMQLVRVLADDCRRSSAPGAQAPVG